MSDSINPYESPRSDPADSAKVSAQDNGFRIYWTLGSIPELADLPRKERGRIWRRHVWNAFRHWQTWLALLFMGAMICGGILGAFYAFRSLQIEVNPFVFAVINGILGGLGGLFYSQVVIAMVRPYVRAKIESQKET